MCSPSTLSSKRKWVTRACPVQNWSPPFWRRLSGGFNYLYFSIWRLSRALGVAWLPYLIWVISITPTASVGGRLATL